MSWGDSVEETGEEVRLLSSDTRQGEDQSYLAATSDEL